MSLKIEFHIPDKERTNSKESFKEYFNEKRCNEIEKGFYDFTHQFCLNNQTITMATAIYKDNVKNFLFNCCQNNRTIQRLIKETNKGKYNPYNLAFLGPEELDEDNWMKILLRKNTTEEKLKNLPTMEWYPCRVCKNTQYHHYQLQTRSADEPMTSFYICKKCNRTYKFNN
jgi:DNA-directed RNA polymerase subunit M/transcription elongation factor TFIIS